MTRRYKDITGISFGYWVVLKYNGVTNEGTALWWCKCICGLEREVRGDTLRSGTTKSCGCKHYESLKKINTRHGLLVDGAKQTPEYVSWKEMKRRCYKSKSPGYYRYGGRGIYVCERWLHNKNGFTNFLSDMGTKPTENHTIDRINNDGNYEPNNCRWATKNEQALNKSTSVWIEYDGMKKLLKEWFTYFNRQKSFSLFMIS